MNEVVVWSDGGEGGPADQYHPTQSGEKSDYYLGYVVISRLFTMEEDGKEDACMNKCIANLGGTSAIHCIMYIAGYERRYTADRANGAYARAVHTSADLRLSEKQSIYEFRMTYDQYMSMCLFMDSFLDEETPYDEKMFTCGWLNFICSRRFMEDNCTTPGTQNCSRYVMDGLVHSGVLLDTEALMFIYPGDVDKCIHAHPDVFRLVSHREMEEGVDRWYLATGTPRRGVHGVGDVELFAKTSSATTKGDYRSDPEDEDGDIIVYTAVSAGAGLPAIGNDMYSPFMQQPDPREDAANAGYYYGFDEEEGEYYDN